jgi:VWFA-related protein
MAGKSWSVPILLCLCAIGLAFNSTVPSLPGATAAAAQSDSSFRLKVDVDLSTIEVAVLDKKGNPVSNLKKEDFQLYEDGKEQEILSIDEVNSRASSLGAGPIDENTPHRGKIVLIIFDDTTIPQLYFQKSRDSAAAFVKEHMRAQDLFAVACRGATMKIFQNLTDDRREVLAAIAQTATFTSTGTFEIWPSLEGINRSMVSLKGQKSVLIYGRPYNYSGSTPYETDTYRRAVDSAKRANVTYYTIEPGSVVGSSFGPEGGGIVTRNSMGRFTTFPQLQAYTLGAPWSLAADTGGFSISNTNDIDAELDKLDQQLSNYYILGFQSNNPKHDGAFRNVKVKTELKGVTLKYRPGYQDRRPVDALASSRQEQRLLTALATPGAATQLPVAFRPMYFYFPPSGARVLVAARIRMEKTTFRKKGQQIGTDLNIMGVAYAENGSIAARFSQTLPISFDKEKEPEFRKGSLAYRNYFKLRPGKYRLKLAVSDESNNLGSIEQSLEVPAFPDQGFAGSSIVIAEQTSQLPDLIRNLQAQLLDENDPLLYQGVQIEPSVENRLRVGSVIPLMFRLYNLPGPPDQWELDAKARLLDETGKEYALGPISLKKTMSVVGDAEAAIMLSLSFQDVPPGKYRLIIETSEASSLKTATLQIDLEFVK